MKTNNKLLNASILGLSALTFWPAGAAAEQANYESILKLPESLKGKIAEHMKDTTHDRFKGWPGMIFYCPVDEEPNPVLKGLCADLEKEFADLANAAKVPFAKARTRVDVAFLPHLTGNAVVAVELDATDPSARPAAIHGRVNVYAHYSQAVNRSSELGLKDSGLDSNISSSAGGKGHPLNKPQHINATLWEGKVTAACATPQECAPSVRSGIAAKLKAFFGEFKAANP